MWISKLFKPKRQFDSQALIEQERALHSFEVRSDAKMRKKLIHPEFYEIGRSGQSYNFEQICSMMSQEQKQAGRVHSQDYQIVELTNTLCQLIYKSAWVDDNGEASFYSKRSSIWLRNKKHWQLKYHHGTPCGAFELLG